MMASPFSLPSPRLLSPTGFLANQFPNAYQRSYISWYPIDPGTANINKPVRTSTLTPAPDALEDDADDVELPLLSELVADSVVSSLPPTPVELAHMSVPKVCALVEKVMSAH